jgi:hypothetical protein
VLLLTAAACAQQPGSSEYGNQFPDAPEPVKLVNGSWQHDPAGDPPKQKTFTKKFVAAHAVFLASVVYDVELTHQGIARHRCVEQNRDLPLHPSRGQSYTEALIPFAVMTGFDVLVQSRHFEKKVGWLAYTGAGYGTFVHISGGTSWLSGCW